MELEDLDNQQLGRAQEDTLPERSWYEKLMAFRGLNHDEFDANVLNFVQLDPRNMLKVTFSAENDRVSPFGDDHGKNINILHLACQEGLSKTAEYIIEQDASQLGF